MGIDIKISIDLSPGQKKIVRAAVVAGAVIGALGIGIAIAAPVQWGASETLTQVKMNAITVIDAGATSISVGATLYCGTGFGNPTNGYFAFNGAMGYAAAKSLCESSTGCGMSKTAHMCDGAELLRSVQVGKSVPAGWYSTATNQDLTIGSGNYQVLDCGGWNQAIATSQSPAPLGPYWNSAPSAASCTGTYSVLCCD